MGDVVISVVIDLIGRPQSTFQANHSDWVRGVFCTNHQEGKDFFKVANIVSAVCALFPPVM